MNTPSSVWPQRLSVPVSPLGGHCRHKVVDMGDSEVAMNVGQQYGRALTLCVTRDIEVGCVHYGDEYLGVG
jgi:hypothetical protein